MRCLTGAQAKGTRRAPCRAEPRSGTCLRSVYDLFKGSPGVLIEWRYDEKNPGIVRQLTDYYGLDIRIIQRGQSGTGKPSLYVLAGEWFGRVYIDYVAQRIEQHHPVTSAPPLPTAADVAAPGHPLRASGAAPFSNSMRS